MVKDIHTYIKYNLFHNIYAFIINIIMNYSLLLRNNCTNYKRPETRVLGFINWYKKKTLL